MGRDDQPIITEDVEQATRRLTRMSALAYPHGRSALDNPLNAPAAGEEVAQEPYDRPSSFLRRVSQKGGDMMKDVAHHFPAPESDDSVDAESIIQGQETYLAALTSESPNASVNTYSGVLTMPPVEVGGPGIDIPLNADNMLLRGAVLRNTEWAIGLACFTGTDTKLVQNSFDTPSKFSQLDKLMNWTVLCILFLMFILITVLASLATASTYKYFDTLWYVCIGGDAFLCRVVRNDPFSHFISIQVHWLSQNKPARSMAISSQFGSTGMAGVNQIIGFKSSFSLSRS